MGGCGFCIRLWPAWRDAVSRAELNQGLIQKLILNMHRPWLDGCGYGRMYDPDKPMLPGFDQVSEPEPGPNARHLYDQHCIRVQWGEWGPEHITVPGNACGLDLDRGCGSPNNGMSLLPHNVDHRDQAMLLLVVFTWIAGYLVSNEEVLHHHERDSASH